MLSFTELAVTVAEANAYAEARAWTTWQGDETVREAALRRAQDFIASTYNGRWREPFENDDAPELVKMAIFAAARRELEAPGHFVPDRDPFGIIKRKRVKAAVVETETEFAEAAANAQPAGVDEIERLLAGLIVAPRSQRVSTSFLARA